MFNEMLEPKKKYSQFKAMLAITKASLHSIVRNPSAVVFNLVFPLIFIIVFGFISGGSFKIDVALDKNSDMNSFVYESLQKLNSLKIVYDLSEVEMRSELEKGRIDGIINIRKNDLGKSPLFIIDLKNLPCFTGERKCFKADDK